MSRIGKAPIAIPAGVTVKVDENNHTVTVKGPKGELVQGYNPELGVKVEDGHRHPSERRPRTPRPARSLPRSLPQHGGRRL